MGEKIASLYAEIGADTTKLQKGLNETKRGLQDVGKQAGNLGNKLASGLAGAAKAFSAVSASALIFASAFKGAMELGKQGAEILYVQQKFDRLAKSIGTTAEVLAKDMNAALKGTMSQAEMMGAASDLMALGLVKTHDEAIRLTKVVGGLGMNMNQLVLTLTNQTTMRFDQLGVSVDGFDAKVNKLKASGMSASDAFKEAFLQQAEEQLERVGNKADTAAGSFMRLDAATKNLSDAVKAKLAPGLADAAESAYLLLTSNEKITAAYNEHSQAVIGTSASYAAYRTEMERAAKVAGKWNINQTTVEFEGLGKAEEEAAINAGILSEAEYEAARAADKAAKSTIKAASANETASHAQEQLNQYLQNTSQSYRDVSEWSENYRSKLDSVASAIDEVKAAQQSANETFANAAAASLEKAGEKNAKYLEGLKAQDEVYGTNNAAIYENQQKLDALSKEFLTTGMSTEEYKTKLAELKPSWDELDTRLKNAEEGFNNAKAAFNSFLSDIGAANGMKITITVDTIRNYINGDTSGITGNDPKRKHGGESEGAAGLSMTVPAGYPNDSYRIGASTGEQVEITPRGGTPRTGGGGMSVTINGNIALPGVTNYKQFMREIGREARRAINTGAASAGG